MKSLLLFALLIFLLGFLPDEDNVMPVDGATTRDWNQQSFWYYPWGRSGVHKGIDIFAAKGTPVRAPTSGIVLFSGSYGRGGQVVYMLGANWRFHYFAHLDRVILPWHRVVSAGQQVGTVGTTGNAQGKAPHLHYTIKSLFPRFWKYHRNDYAAWQKVFYLDPGKFIQGIPQ